MCSYVVTAALLLMCISVVAEYQYEPCDDGWSRLDENRCVKYINSPKTFHEAQVTQTHTDIRKKEHCRTLNGDLVSLHSYDEMFKVIYLIRRAVPRCQSIWIGAQRSGTVVKYIDGSDFNVPPWLYDPSNYPESQDCIKLNVKGRGSFKGVRCSKKKCFVCAKNVMTSTTDAGPSVLQPSPVPDGPEPSPVPV